jgi:Bacterial Ig-like domain (group 1)
MNMFTQVRRHLLLGVSALALLACGGGAGSSAPSTSGGTGGTGGATSTTPVATQLEFSTSATQLDSAGISSAGLSVTAKNASNAVVPGVSVSYVASSGSLLVNNAATDDKGVSKATLSVGSNKSNRTISVTATAGAVSANAVIDVRGTTLTVSGPTAVGLASSVTLLLSLKDSAGAAIANAPVSFSSKLNNGANKGCSPASCATDASGALSISYTPAGGADVITLSAMGAVVTQNVLAATSMLDVVVAPDAGVASPNEFSIGQTNKMVTVTLTGTSVTYPATILLSSTAGTITPASVTVTGSGVPNTVAILNTNNSVGSGVVFAQHNIANGVSNTFPFEVVSRSAVTMTLQASPAVIPANAAGVSTSKSTITAIVRDSTGNPVKGAVVSFSKSSDTSSGSLQSPSSISNSLGVASTNYIAGPNSASGTGVTISASATGVAISPSINVTVAQQALYVNLGFGSVLNIENTTEYSKDISVSVSDAAGQPVAGANVVLQLRASRFFKGQMVQGTTTWVIDLASYTACASEDVNNNGTIEGAEDINLNGRLDPGVRPTVIQIAGGATPGTTDATGFARFKMKYLKNDALWSEYFVVASSNTAQGGSQGNTERVTILSVAASEVADKNVSPPNQLSPFGYLNNQCNSPN